MIAAALGVLTASLLGSVHCAAMCGGFVCMYSSGSGADAATVRAHALYNLGRLVSYLVLGALAGALGSGITRIGALAGVTQAATIMAGALMVAWGISTIAAQRGVRLGFGSLALSQRWQRLLGGMLHGLRGQPVAIRAALTGLGTTLLPCGWLYVFVATAGGTGNVRDGMLVMAVFWLGTVPALVTVGLGAQRVFGPLRRKLPTLGAVTVMLMGLLALSGRLGMAPTTTMAHDMATHGH
ncbi:MAG: sulfite exporter TauE/SafE family protein [Gemmatimonadaceae bacterium]|nr:sulfite exporter TauE/SafE family protein [Gemmatimonadaceae bacterium]